jgi:hypothetical protein
MAKAVLEYFVRRVVTNSIEISFQQYIPVVRTPRTPSESAVLAANRGKGMIM